MKIICAFDSIGFLKIVEIWNKGRKEERQQQFV